MAALKKHRCKILSVEGGEDKMRRRRVKPLDEAVQHVTSATDKTDVLESKLINPYKGRGVFALASLNKGDFVVEYRGELIDFRESERRRKVSRSTVFMFDFFWQNKQWCIDATREDDTLGRLVNDEYKDPNCKMKKIIVQGKPHLCLFAMRDIMPGEEITYDYGGSDWPWRRKPACKDTANMKDNVEPIRSASGPVTNAGASTSDLKPACEDTTNMMDEVEPCLSASGPLTNTGASSSDLKHACEATANMMDEVEPCLSASGPLTNTGASSSDLKHACEDSANMMDVVEQSRSASSPVTNTGASSSDLKPECEDAANVMAVVESSHSASDPVTIAGASSTVLKGSVRTFRKTNSILIQERTSDYSDDLFDSTDDNFNSSKSSVEDNHAGADKVRKLEHTWAGNTLRKRQSSQFRGKSPDNLDECIDTNEELSDHSEGSEEEYIPDTSEDSSDSSTLFPSLSKCKRRPLASPLQSTSTSPNPLCQNSISSSTSQIRSSSRNGELQSSSDTQNSRSCDKTLTPDSTSFVDQESTSHSVIIPAVSKKSDGGRMYDKKQHCLFCGLAFSKLARHLERKHSKEVEVAKALSHPKGSKKRRMQLEYLRNKGNFEHNSVVLKTGKGKLVPRKLPKKLSDGEDFIPCIHCQGLFLKKTLWRHVKVCKFKPGESTPKPGKTRVQALCSFATPPPPGVADGVWKLICAMNQDRVALAVRNDQCIIDFGKHLYNKYGSQVKMHEYIRQKMRELGRLQICTQEVTPLKCIKDLIRPENFMHTVTAVKQTAGYNKDTNKYESASVAVKLGHSLNRIAMLVESNATIEGDKATAKEASSFQKIYSSRWHEYISATARRTLEEAKWNSPQLLPFTEDVKRLHLYLDEQEHHYRKMLSAEPSSQHWSQLAKVTLTQMMLFNRRREGEVSHMPLSAYTSKDASDPHPDVCLALSELEKKLCQHFKRIEIRGKRGRKVAVLVTPTMQESLDVLVKNRSKCGVLQENIYLFARPSAMTCFRGSDCIRDFAKASGVKNPSTLTSTKLRKQIGTLSEVLNLSNAELDQLADFLGHDIRVHRQFYRLPEGTLQLAKLSKILLAFEKGRLAEFKGRNLDEINIDPDEQVTVDSELEEPESSMTECDAPMSLSQDNAGQLDEEADQVLRSNKKVRVCDAPLSLPQVSAGQNDSETGQLLRSIKRKRGPCKRTPWSVNEIHAVEKHMMRFIQNWKVPGKADCVRCVEAEPLALKNRDWLAVKFYVKNRITALQRQV